MKKIIYTSWKGHSLDHNKFCRTLLQYRNTPSCKDGLSPAQKLYGHPVQDTLPAHRRSFSQEWQRKAEQQAEATQQSSATYYNLHAHPLTEIEIGSNVAVQNPRTKLWDIYGIITAISPNRNITSKRPAAGCWCETATLYAEKFLCLCQHVLHCQIPLLLRQPKNSTVQHGSGNHPIV